MVAARTGPLDVGGCRSSSNPTGTGHDSAATRPPRGHSRAADRMVLRAGRPTSAVPTGTGGQRRLRDAAQPLPRRPGRAAPALPTFPRADPTGKPAIPTAVIVLRPRPPGRVLLVRRRLDGQPLSGEGIYYARLGRLARTGGLTERTNRLAATGAGSPTPSGAPCAIPRNGRAIHAPALAEAALAPRRSRACSTLVDSDSAGQITTGCCRPPEGLVRAAAATRGTGSVPAG